MSEIYQPRSQGLSSSHPRSSGRERERAWKLGWKIMPNVVNHNIKYGVETEK